MTRYTFDWFKRKPKSSKNGKWMDAEEVLSLLKKIEWVEHDSTCIERCPFCKNSYRAGHTQDCEIRKTLGGE